MEKRVKRWQFTINSTIDHNENEIKAIFTTLIKLKSDNDIGYMIYQLERGKNKGTLHIQGYLEYNTKNGKNMSKTKELIGCDWVHLEQARGNGKQNKEYCSKSDTKESETIEFGTMMKGQGYRSDLEKVTKEIIEGKGIQNIAIENPTEFVKYSKGIKELKAIVDKDKSKIIRDVVVEIYYGDPGTGKSWIAKDENKDYYTYLPKNGGNMWFDGYDGESTLIIDEFNCQIPFQTLLKILEGYQQPLEIKGGSTFANWTKVIIISNIDPIDWYSDMFRNKKEEEKIKLKGALYRRVSKCIKFSLPVGVIPSKTSYMEAKYEEIKLL